MASLYLLIPISVFLLIIGICIYFWAVRSGQYDDLDGEGERILFDDEPLKLPVTSIKPETASQDTDSKSQNSDTL